MSDRVAALEAELELRKAEEAFIAKKLAGKATAEDRAALHEIRRAYRENQRPPVSDGAAPAAIGTKAEAKGVG
jgi:hypothetical protein